MLKIIAPSTNESERIYNNKKALPPAAVNKMDQHMLQPTSTIGRISWSQTNESTNPLTTINEPSITINEPSINH